MGMFELASPGPTLAWIRADSLPPSSSYVWAWSLKSYIMAGACGGKLYSLLSMAFSDFTHITPSQPPQNSEHESSNQWFLGPDITPELLLKAWASLVSVGFSGWFLLSDQRAIRESALLVLEALHKNVPICPRGRMKNDHWLNCSKVVLILEPAYSMGNTLSPPSGDISVWAWAPGRLSRGQSTYRFNSVLSSANPAIGWLLPGGGTWTSR